MRCDDTNTVRPSSASDFRSVRTQRTPSGSSPLTGSSRITDLWLAEQGRGDAEPLSHAETEPPDPLSGDGGQPDQLEDLVDPATAHARGLGESQQVVAGRPSGVDCLGLQQDSELGHGGGGRAYAFPFTRTRPEVGASSPAIIRIVVDFPAPFGPRNPVTVPGGATKLRSSTARVGP